MNGNGNLVGVPDPSYGMRNFGPLFEAFKMEYGDALEFIPGTLFDTQQYPLAGTLQLNYFTARAATADMGNLALGNTLPARTGFLIMSIRVQLDSPPQNTTAVATGTVQTGNVSNFTQILNRGTVDFEVLNKNYGQWPLWMLPAGGGVAATIATGDIDIITDYANNGLPDARNMYVLETPLFLSPLVNFNIFMRWPALRPIVVNVTPITLLFDGMTVRPVQ